MDLEERIAQAIDPGAFNCTYPGPHGAAYQAADQDQAREIASEIIRVLHLGVTRVDHTHAYTHQQITGWWIETTQAQEDQ